MYKSINRLFLGVSFAFASLLSLPSFAFMSEEVMQAMDQANFCKKANQDLVFIECMRRNNEFVRKAIIEKSAEAVGDMPVRKQKTIKNSIQSSIQSKIKRCMNEQTLFAGQAASNQRHEYCLYENMLEILINIERNIEIYAR